MELIRSCVAIAILRKKNKIGGITLPNIKLYIILHNIKLYYKTIVIKTTW